MEEAETTVTAAANLATPYQDEYAAEECFETSGVILAVSTGPRSAPSKPPSALGFLGERPDRHGVCMYDK